MTRLKLILELFSSVMDFFFKYMQGPEDKDDSSEKIKNIIQIKVKNPQIGGPTLYVARKVSSMPTEEIPQIYPLDTAVTFTKSDEFTYVAKISATISELPDLIDTLKALGFCVYIPDLDGYVSAKI